MRAVLLESDNMNSGVYQYIAVIFLTTFPIIITVNYLYMTVTTLHECIIWGH